MLWAGQKERRDSEREVFGLNSASPGLVSGVSNMDLGKLQLFGAAGAPFVDLWLAPRVQKPPRRFCAAKLCNPAAPERSESSLWHVLCWSGSFQKSVGLGKKTNDPYKDTHEKNQQLKNDSRLRQEPPGNSVKFLDAGSSHNDFAKLFHPGAPNSPKSALFIYPGPKIPKIRVI